METEQNRSSLFDFSLILGQLVGVPQGGGLQASVQRGHEHLHEENDFQCLDFAFWKTYYGMHSLFYKTDI